MMFAWFMVIFLIVTGVIWLVDSLVLRKSRDAGAPEPIVVEYAKSFFPVIFAVFLIRSFVVEPFKIPSGSMMPTLLAGDFILVNKFTYGLRVPILNNAFIHISEPHRGDVFVFHYPEDPSVDYIKRVVGVPGDKVVYHDKVLYINGQKMEQQLIGEYDYSSSGLNMVYARRLKEDLMGVPHDILIDDASPIGDFEFNVPEKSYFAMGDNRDNSRDSRYWGFVPEQNLVGKAFFIWFNLDDAIDFLGKFKFERIGTIIK